MFKSRYKKCWPNLFLCPINNDRIIKFYVAKSLVKTKQQNLCDIQQKSTVKMIYKKMPRIFAFVCLIAVTDLCRLKSIWLSTVSSTVVSGSTDTSTSSRISSLYEINRIFTATGSQCCCCCCCCLTMFHSVNHLFERAGPPSLFLPPPSFNGGYIVILPPWQKKGFLIDLLFRFLSFYILFILKRFDYCAIL